MKRGLVFALLLALLLTTPVQATEQEEVVIGASQKVENGEKVIAEAATMQFPEDNRDVELFCPVCYKVVVWQALYLEAEINTQDTRRLNNRHIYMAGDLKGEDIYDPLTNTGGFMFRTNKENEHSVIHLNGHKLDASQGVLMVESGEVSIIGKGTAWGRRNNPDFGSSLDVRNGAQLNIYGGTYYRISPQPLLKIVEEGTANIYGGTLVANEKYENSSVKVENGTCNIYGGMLEGGFANRVGGNLMVETDGVAAIHGGELLGGLDATGGNISNAGKLHITGGKISGAIRGADGSLVITGGEISSEIDSTNVRITGGTFTKDVRQYVQEGFKVKLKDGIYTVTEGSAGLPWQWLAIGGGALVVLVALIVVLTAAGKKKKKQEV